MAVGTGYGPCAGAGANEFASALASAAFVIAAFVACVAVHAPAVLEFVGLDAPAAPAGLAAFAPVADHDERAVVAVAAAVATLGSFAGAAAAH